MKTEKTTNTKALKKSSKKDSIDLNTQKNKTDISNPSNNDIKDTDKETNQTTEKVENTKTSSKKRRNIDGATFYVEATYNNTKAMIADRKGNTIAWSSAGKLGFKGAKKGTPFAALKLGETLGDKALELGIKEANVIVSGVGSGRESAIRSFIGKGITIGVIKDVTPVPHNGPKPKKPRRV